MTGVFCPRCGASPAMDPCASCGYTARAGALGAWKAGLRRCRQRPVATLGVWLPCTVATTLAATLGTRSAEAPFPAKAVGGSVALVAMLLAAFLTLGAHAAVLGTGRRGPGAAAWPGRVGGAAFAAAGLAGVPWIAAVGAGTWVQTRPQESVGAAAAQLGALLLVGVGIFVTARVFPAAVLAAGERPVGAALASAARVSRGRGGLAVTVVGGLGTFALAAAAGVLAAPAGVVAVSAAEGVAFWVALALWGTWAVESVAGDGPAAAFVCPRCGAQAMVRHGRASCHGCGMSGDHVPWR